MYCPPSQRGAVVLLSGWHPCCGLLKQLVERAYADIVLVDIIEGMPQGKALDLLESGPISGFDSQITGTNNYQDTAGSDIVVVTSGMPRKPGMSRDDLVLTNAKIVASVGREIAKYSPNAVVIVVSNPLDAMAQVAYRVTAFPKERVLGMAGVLDTARFRTFLAQELNTSVHDVEAYVLGGHGDTMVPVVGMTTVAGVPIDQLMSAEKLSAIVQRTRDGGAEIVNLLKASAYYAPSAAVVQMVDAIMLDTRRVLPCSAYLNGEYGISGLFTGVPCRLGRHGIEEIVSIPLTEPEQAALTRSAAAVREAVEIIDARKNDVDAALPQLFEQPTTRVPA